MGFLTRLMQLIAGIGQSVMRLFTRGGRGPSGDIGLYYYIRSYTSGEVIRLRINPHNDLSLTDDESGFFVRKVVVGTRSYQRIEAEFTYNKNRKLVNAEIMGGTLVDEAAYLADQAQHAATSESGDQA